MSSILTKYQFITIYYTKLSLSNPTSPVAVRMFVHCALAFTSQDCSGPILTKLGLYYPLIKGFYSCSIVRMEPPDPSRGQRVLKLSKLLEPIMTTANLSSLMCLNREGNYS